MLHTLHFLSLLMLTCLLSFTSSRFVLMWGKIMVLFQGGPRTSFFFFLLFENVGE